MASEVVKLTRKNPGSPGCRRASRTAWGLRSCRRPLYERQRGNDGEVTHGWSGASAELLLEGMTDAPRAAIRAPGSSDAADGEPAVLGHGGGLRLKSTAEHAERRKCRWSKRPRRTRGHGERLGPGVGPAPLSGEMRKRKEAHHQNNRACVSSVRQKAASAALARRLPPHLCGLRLTSSARARGEHARPRPSCRRGPSGVPSCVRVAAWPCRRDAASRQAARARRTSRARRRSRDRRADWPSPPAEATRASRAESRRWHGPAVRTGSCGRHRTSGVRSCAAAARAR